MMQPWTNTLYDLQSYKYITFLNVVPQEEEIHIHVANELSTQYDW